MMLSTNAARKDGYRNGFKRALYFVIGTVSLVLGGVGVLLPVLPTTPFLLLSAACYYKSSRRMHYWMLNNRWFGDYLRNYAEGKGVSLRAKLSAMSLLWMLIIYSVFFAVSDLFVRIVLLSIAAGVTIHLIRLPTVKAE